MDAPIKPDESDCCNSGCTPCIFDVYEKQLALYLSKKCSLKNYQNCIIPTSYSVFKLIQVEQHSTDCYFYTFEFLKFTKQIKLNDFNPSVVYLPGQHFLIRNIDFTSAYTPIYCENQPKNQFTVLVKLYENGKMSQYFRELRITDETLWRGPYGDYEINYKEENMLFIAQGTGIAPLYTIICSILNNENCYTFLTLFYCCNLRNLLLRDKLYEMARYWNFHYEYFIPSANGNDLQLKYNETINFTRLNSDSIHRYLYKRKGNNGKILICGSEKFCNEIQMILKELIIDDKNIVIFSG